MNDYFLFNTNIVSTLIFDSSRTGNGTTSTTRWTSRSWAQYWSLSGSMWSSCARAAALHSRSASSITTTWRARWSSRLPWPSGSPTCPSFSTASVSTRSGSPGGCLRSRGPSSCLSSTRSASSSSRSSSLAHSSSARALSESTRHHAIRLSSYS